MTNLSKLVAQFGLEPIPVADVAISGVAQNAQLVRLGDLFIALKGQKFHGLDFAKQAISNGAVAILSDKDSAVHFEAFGVPILLHPNPRLIAGNICAEVYDLSNFRIFGITGTNGKTSTATYLAWLLNKAGISSGLSASTERIVGNQTLPAGLTTPEVSELFRLLSDMKAAGNRAAVIEVSAQAIQRNRIDGLRFEVSGFTNLSRDHLDDFENMNAYLAVKKRLFTEFSETSVINVEDQYGKSLAKEISGSITIGAEGTDWVYEISNSIPAELKLNSGGKYLVSEVAAGSLMAKNFALALVMANVAGVSHEELQLIAGNVDIQVPGRLQRVSKASPAVYVDYAHTPAGVAAAVSEISKTTNYLTVVLGASGNRDRGKRPEMALATKGADHLVITDQHPRDEEPKGIRSTLLAAAQKIFSKEQLSEIADPAKAIEFAISTTPKDGAVLWCGPGHLKYREIAGAKVPFNAIEIAKKLVEAAN